ncbi:hypothetical protein CHS0354_020093 [Potamilus streckersoni]|uniref:Uncharacterized protein n=1 Tax=Potamilus streckersoni TaxID=2493646 RepID=A0AAE0VU40_9BIVA|nr:hypothetical protein CHS0354_020093 [Potamilus streckersoni]
MKVLMLVMTLCLIAGHEVGSLEVATKEKELSHEVLSCYSSEMYPCDIDRNECIPASQVCNGIIECTNASDENVETCGCLPNEFHCNSSVCIDIIHRCDQKKDCVDGADELDCETYSCPSTHSKCANHFCVPNDFFCNFINDCGDNSDEENCHYRECFSTEFPCRNGQCQPNALLCDSIGDCVDKSDEEDCGGNCTKDQISCDNGRCIRKSNVCDGVCDCFGTCQDEIDCGSLACPTGEMYLCKGSKRCINKQYLCDGINDCWNTKVGVDEYFCGKLS